MSEFTAKDFILLLLNSDNQKPIKGNLFLQKEMFLIVEEVCSSLKDELNFIPYDYGPYSFNLINLLTSLKNDSLIDYDDLNDNEYSITKKGIDYLKKIDFPESIIEKVNKLKIGSNKLGYNGLLRYVYFNYPKYTKKSKIGGKYGLSKEDKTYKKMTMHDAEHQNENYEGVVLTPKRAEDGLHEDFAESLAMTALIMDGKHPHAVMNLSDGGKQSCKRWVKRFKYRYNYCKNILEETSLKRMIKKYINKVFKDAYC